MKVERSIIADATCLVLMAVFLSALVLVTVRLKMVQVDSVAEYGYANLRQSTRKVHTVGGRGRILDCRSRPLADNRQSLSIVCDAAAFQQRSWEKTAAAIESAIDSVASEIGVPSRLVHEEILRHLNQERSIPLVVWGDIGRDEIDRFCEHASAHPGFSVRETEERVYPGGELAAHLLGYVGRSRSSADDAGVKCNFYDREMYGRSGLEFQYDAFLRGFAGERDMLVDAVGFPVREWTVTEAKRGPDLKLTLDIDLQRVVERELVGEKGACVVLDPRTGAVLAAASSPTYDPNRFVPVLASETYQRYATDPAKPLLNRAFAGSYAPGSTFKPITALAGLTAGYPSGEPYECTGVFACGNLKLRCARRWGHGEERVREALRDSCNPFFCNLGYDIGTNQLIRAAKALGLGRKTGIDFPVEAAGVVPDAGWKNRVYGEQWFPGDLIQMSIGQGMLLVTPLQMACVAGAIGTGRLVKPRLAEEVPVESVPLPFGREVLKVVREGMTMVVNDRNGTGRNGGVDVPVKVAGKTGTAEVGINESKRKNTWFIAYAPVDDPRVAVAMVIENGVSGGGTTAPKVARILKAVEW